MSGSVPFIALRPCGCVFSDASIRAVIPNLTKGIAARAVPKDSSPDEARPVVEVQEGKVACPNCGKSFDPALPSSILPINPSRDVQEILLENLLITRATAKSTKKRKVVDITTPSVDVEQPHKVARPASARQQSSASPAPGSLQPTSMPRSVHQKLAEQEQKRILAQAGMSDAVKAMFKPKDKGADHHAGNADFFGRTFNRVSLGWTCEGDVSCN